MQRWQHLSLCSGGRWSWQGHSQKNSHLGWEPCFQPRPESAHEHAQLQLFCPKPHIQFTPISWALEYSFQLDVPQAFQIQHAQNQTYCFPPITSWPSNLLLLLTSPGGIIELKSRIIRCDIVIYIKKSQSGFVHCSWHRSPKTLGIS